MTHSQKKKWMPPDQHSKLYLIDKAQTEEPLEERASWIGFQPASPRSFWLYSKEYKIVR